MEAFQERVLTFQQSLVEWYDWFTKTFPESNNARYHLPLSAVSHSPVLSFFPDWKKNGEFKFFLSAGSVSVRKGKSISALDGLREIKDGITDKEIRDIGLLFRGFLRKRKDFHGRPVEIAYSPSGEDIENGDLGFTLSHGTILENLRWDYDGGRDFAYYRFGDEGGEIFRYISGPDRKLKYTPKGLEIQNRKNELVLSAISRMESALKGLADDYFGN